MRLASQLLRASKPVNAYVPGNPLAPFAVFVDLIALIAPSNAFLASKVSAASLRSFSSSLIFQSERVKVPTMAESITEGTLKTWSKQVGDFVKQDEEIAYVFFFLHFLQRLCDWRIETREGGQTQQGFLTRPLLFLFYSTIETDKVCPPLVLFHLLFLF